MAPAESTHQPAAPQAQGGPPALSPSDQLKQLVGGAWVTQMIHVAAELGVADQLACGERPRVH